MLRTEKLEGFSSVNIKECRSSSVKTRWRPRQKGSILIGIIITMVVMATLAGGMVYLTTTSTFQELFSNNHARAYYAAESGGMYASFLARQALANGTFDTLHMNTTNPDNILTEYTLADGEKFRITNWTPTPISGSMTVTFDSIGTVGSGFLEAKRKLTYNIHPSNQGSGGGSGNPPIPVAYSDFDKTGGGSDAAWLKQVYSPTDNAETKIFAKQPDGDNALNLSSDLYTIGIKWYMNSSLAQLDAIRANNGGLLSYGAQVKVLIDQKDKISDYNIIGISFRLDDTNTTTRTVNTEFSSYGLSFFKIQKQNGAKTPTWYNTEATLFKTNDAWLGISNNNWYVVLWKRVGGEYGPHTLLAYKKLLPEDWVIESDAINIKRWSTLRVKIMETIAAAGDTYGFTSGTRYNVITSYLAANLQGTTGVPLSSELYHRKTTTPLQPYEIEWSGAKFKPVNWEAITGGAIGTIGTNIVADSSLTTSNYITPSTDPTNEFAADHMPREIGLHVYYDSTSAQNVFYDNFYIDLTPSGYGAGYVDGSGRVIVGP